MSPTWEIKWSHGHGFIEKLGGMLGPVNFILPTKTIQPFAVFPWYNEKVPEGQEKPSGLMERGRGEWPCVPFGRNNNPCKIGWNHPIHGEPAHNIWQRIDDGKKSEYLRIIYKCQQDGPIDSIEREITGIAGKPSVDCKLIINVRVDCSLPIGLHPVLRLPKKIGALVVHPSKYKFVHTYPFEVEEGRDIIAENKKFINLKKAPRRNKKENNTVNLLAYPLSEQTESLIQLCEIDGHVAVDNLEEDYKFELKWDEKILPSLIFWISNGGFTNYPWNSRHYGLGLEPVCSAFDLGVDYSTNTNIISDAGIPTAVNLRKSSPLIINYNFSVSDLKTYL